VGGAIPLVGFLVTLAVAGPLLLGLTAYFLLFARDEAPQLEDVFVGFTRYTSAVVLYLLVFIFTFLWSLLLIVPGIVAAYRYSMAYCILSDNPDIGAKEALERSKAAMMGKKGQLFWLDASFFGWALLCILTLGIGFLWLAPYWKLSRTYFYERLVRGEGGTGGAEPVEAPVA
jgi:uncharacterized membrane protein